jgi:hypothetical protein
MTPLHGAAELGLAKLILVLVAKGADPSIKNAVNESALASDSKGAAQAPEKRPLAESLGGSRSTVKLLFYFLSSFLFLFCLAK